MFDHDDDHDGHDGDRARDDDHDGVHDDARDRIKSDDGESLLNVSQLQFQQSECS